MNQRPLVIKLGGAVLSSTETLTELFKTVSNYQQQAQRSLVIVHGGGYLVDELMAKLQLETVKKEGLRVTPKEQIGYITGALAGTANKMLQGQAMKNGVNAMGLSLADGGLCKITQLNPELGNVGLATAGDATILNAVLATQVTPIISSIGITAEGELMNVNADQAAVAVATALDADLVLLSDVAGVLDGEKQLIASLDSEQAELLIQQEVITDGMIVKVRAALEAAQELGRAIEVASWRSPEKLAELFIGNSIGTQFQPQ
ncbi:acetylglutamate kinase [Aliivibrio sifiae]|uniref:Acetylglutamate kinase n=1 Tax=Aliivibrio sifiae TaxID=566293 RepID=A0A2S7XM68_9GAMM|nr:acetylglutamate kinase [Aliivibrio sifiae]PQJ94502.1 acetylglutamate kinase [Aliivibrio sifiae]GLR75692.1 acetylglutamate kinase [Aliivibrio sifiae]